MSHEAFTGLPSNSARHDYGNDFVIKVKICTDNRKLANFTFKSATKRKLAKPWDKKNE